MKILASTVALVFLLVGCAPTKPITITEYETVEVFRDRYVQLPPNLVAPVDLSILSDDFDIYDLGAAYKLRGLAIEQCNAKLAEIKRISNED
jgi:hypothetical protein